MIAELKVCLKDVATQLPFHFHEGTGEKLLSLGLVDISVSFKNVGYLPEVPGSNKRHQQVDSKQVMVSDLVEFGVCRLRKPYSCDIFGRLARIESLAVGLGGEREDN